MAITANARSKNGNVSHKMIRSAPKTIVKIMTAIPITKVTARTINPTNLIIIFTTNEAIRSPILNSLLYFSLNLFHGESNVFKRVGIEKKWLVNQMKFPYVTKADFKPAV